MLICHIKNLENKVGSQDYFSKNDLFVSIYCNGKIHKTEETSFSCAWFA